MKCPSCSSAVEPDEWICPGCDYILDPSVLGDVYADGEAKQPVQEERTKMIAWSPAESDDSPMPEAMILGDVNVSGDEFQMVKGAGANSSGRTSTFLYYAAGSTTRVIHPDAVPRVLARDTELPTTPYEDFLLSCVDGKRSVRAIQRLSGLAPQEVVVTLLTLLDKGAVKVITSDGLSGVTPKPEDPSDKPGPSRAQLARKRRRRRRAPTAPPSKTKRKTNGKKGPPPPPPPDPASIEAAPIEPPSAKLPPVPIAPSRLRETEPPDVATDDLPSTPTEVPTKQHELRAGAVPDDFDDLPEVASFAELTEEPTAGVRPLVSLEDDEGSYDDLDDVWATGPGSSVDAQYLIEDEASEDRSSASTETHQAAEDDLRPSTIEDPPKRQPPPIPEEVTEVPQLEEDTVQPTAQLIPPEPPPMPDLSSDSAAIEPPLISPVLDPTPPPSSAPAPKARKKTPPALLDPAFLVEVPPSVAAPVPAAVSRPSVDGVVDAEPSSGVQKSPEALKEERKRALAAMLKRGPIQERDRRRPSKAEPKDPAERKSPDPAERPERAERVERVERPEPAPEPAAPVEPEAPPEPRRRGQPIDSYRMVKAEKLFEQAIKDKAEGNLVSARMNMKLALTFDPTNELFEKALSEISKNPEAQTPKERPMGRSKARELYDNATEAEQNGDVDRAIELLEKAIEESKQAPFYNRLGVLLAMKKRRFMEAQELISKALEIAPGNATYEKNLQKVLSMAAAMDVSPTANKKSGGLLGFLGRRK